MSVRSAVNTTGTGAITPGSTAGPNSTDGCTTRYTDVPSASLLPLYTAASAGCPGACAATTGTFQLRFVVDNGGGLTVAAGTGVRHLPEIYVRIQ